MVSRQRHSTRYAGVFYVMGTSAKGKPEKIYFIRYRKNGKLVEEKVGRQFRDDMTPARAAGIRAQKIDGNLPTNEEKRVQEEAEKHARMWTIEGLWSEYRSQRKQNKNLQTDHNRYKQFLQKPFGNKLPSEIISLDVDRLRRGMLKQYSPQTTKHALALLKRIANFGFKKGLTPPLSFAIEMPKVDNIVDDSLTDEELQRLFPAIEEDEHPHAGNLMLLALFTGMRRGELFKLKWDDIDFIKGFISIRGPKGGKSEIIPLNEHARHVLENHIQTESDFVFPGKSGKQRTNIQKPVNRIKEAAKIPKWKRPLHSLRHTFATGAINSGVDLYTLQKLTTHKTAKMVERYAHLNDNRLKNGSSTAGDAIAGALTRGADQMPSNVVNFMKK